MGCVFSTPEFGWTEYDALYTAHVDEIGAEFLSFATLLHFAHRYFQFPANPEPVHVPCVSLLWDAYKFPTPRLARIKKQADILEDRIDKHRIARRIATDLSVSRQCPGPAQYFRNELIDRLTDTIHAARLERKRLGYAFLVTYFCDK